MFGFLLFKAHGRIVLTPSPVVGCSHVTGRAGEATRSLAQKRSWGWNHHCPGGILKHGNVENDLKRMLKKEAYNKPMRKSNT